MKKIGTLLVMLTLFLTMGMTVQAKDQGENEQSAKIFSMLEEELSEHGEDVLKWLSEELAKEEKEKILQVMQKIKDMGLDPEKLLGHIEDLYDEVGSDLVKEAEETVKRSFVESVTGFFHDMGTRVKGFFTDIFS